MLNIVPVDDVVASILMREGSTLKTKSFVAAGLAMLIGASAASADVVINFGDHVFAGGTYDSHETGALTGTLTGFEVTFDANSFSGALAENFAVVLGSSQWSGDLIQGSSLIAGATTYVGAISGLAADFNPGDKTGTVDALGLGLFNTIFAGETLLVHIGNAGADFTSMDLSDIVLTLFGLDETVTNPGGNVVPLPAAAWAGLVLLGGIGAKRIRRRASA